jgi:hypothetical protein
VASRIPLSSDTLRKRVTTALANYLDSEVELESLTLHFSPSLHAEGTNLVIRHHGRHDVPPLISIRGFAVSASLRGLWNRRVDHVLLDGLNIQVPPRDGNNDEKDVPTDAAGKGDVAESPKKTDVKAPSPDKGSNGGGSYAKQIVITELETPDAQLTTLRSDPTKPARTWSLHSLKMQNVGMASAMPFQTLLSNAVPPGLIRATGHFGPWQSDDPGATPLDGLFTFDDANLGVFEGISGILSSNGSFGGTLDRIVIDGKTETPDFMVTVGGHQVPLSTTYHAVVDGTNGDTTLDPVNATFLKTSLVARGGVYDAKGVKGRIVTLDVTMENGRMEDLMRLAVHTPTPPMTGGIYLHTKFVIPPGKGDVVDKLQLDGRFAIDSGRFTDAGVQSKVNQLSHRARGRTSSPEKPEKVVSDFRGRFTLGKSRLALPIVTFDIPGAIVQLGGAYSLRRETIDFNGSLFMDAKISETMTGFKSLLLKLADPFFRKNGRTVVPLKISGTRNDPHFGLDVKRVFKAKDDAPQSVPVPRKKTP